MWVGTLFVEADGSKAFYPHEALLGGSEPPGRAEGLSEQRSGCRSKEAGQQTSRMASSRLRARWRFDWNQVRAGRDSISSAC